MDLENGIHQAIWMIEFLHGCLTNPAVYQYAYPEHTVQRLEQLRALAPPPELCVHSRHHPECPACRAHVERVERRAHAT